MSDKYKNPNIDSRIEKFLYAILTSDLSDLPNSSSRIEELYQCWAEGTKPVFYSPKSRVECYLLCILGVYDTHTLPSPLSRYEKLLYKIANNDDNLDDIKTIQSEIEFLLISILTNGKLPDEPPDEPLDNSMYLMYDSVNYIFDEINNYIELTK